MHFYQQEEYDNIRFIKYIFTKLKLIDKKFTITLLFLQFFLYLSNFSEILFGVIPLIISLFIYLEQDPCKAGKKKLVLTARVKRIFAISAIALAIIFFLFLALDNYLIIKLIFIIQLLPFILVVANFLLVPYEKKIQRNYLYDAQKKLAEFKPQIIAVTGSYGKTSTKHILHHILSSLYPTLTTSGSINTLMGITRIIRNKLSAAHKYFIVEMGAYGINSIKSLCDLTPPNYGIITAVGNAHYERFKHIDNVAKAKFELSDAVALQQGNIFLNSDAIKNDYIEKYGKNIIRIGSNLDAEYQISALKHNQSGLSFKLCYAKKTYLIETPLFGVHHAGNIALAFAMAHKLGADPEIIIAALRSLPQIKHRLEVIKQANAPIIIDDAYNANPQGFISALEILDLLKQNSGKRILVTPGMVELGDLHDEKHFELGKIAAKYVDICLIIQPERINSFVESFKKHKKDEQHIYDFANFTEAKKWISLNSKKEDIILYENDLPDLYENKLVL